MGGLTRVTRRGRGWEPEQNTDNDTQGMKHIFKQVQYTPVPESTLVHARTEKHTCQGEQHTVLPTRAFDRVRCGWGASRADGPPVRASTCRDAADMTITAGLLGGGGSTGPTVPRTANHPGGGCVRFAVKRGLGRRGGPRGGGRMKVIQFHVHVRPIHHTACRRIAAELVIVRAPPEPPKRENVRRISSL